MVKKGLLVIVLSSGRKPALENVITVQKNTTNTAKNNKSRSSSKATPAETCGSSCGPAKRDPAGSWAGGGASLPVWCRVFMDLGLHSSAWRRMWQIVIFPTTEYFENKMSERSVLLLPLHFFYMANISCSMKIHPMKVTKFFQTPK